MALYPSANMPFANLCEISESYDSLSGMKAQSESVCHLDGEVGHACFHGGNANLDEQDDG